MAFWKERWDPVNNGPFNTKYKFNNGTFSEGDGDFIRYNNEGNTYNGKVTHVYWNPKTQEIYYQNPLGQYTLANVGDLKNVQGGFFEYLGDDQLDEIAKSILQDLDANKERALRRRLSDEPQDRILQTPVPSPTFKDSLQLEEYRKKLIEAEELLRKMTIPETEEDSPEDTTVYYKYGPDEIDLKYYLHNLGTNLLNYINSLDWNQALKDAFVSAYNNYKQGLTDQLENGIARFSTDDAGNILDNTGVLYNNPLVIDSNGNIYNSIDEISDKKLRKKAIEFSPNLEVANYLNAVASAVVGAGKTRKISSDNLGNFDLNANGFIKYLSNKINPAGGVPDIAPILALDPMDPTGKRAKTNRTKYLAFELNNYLNKIKKGKHNFENTPFKTKDAYIKKVQAAIDNLNNGWDLTDVSTLQAIGITPDFYEAILTETADPTMTDALIEEELQKRKLDAQDLYINELESEYNRYIADLPFVKDLGINVIKDSRYTVDDNGKSRAAFNLINTLGFTDAGTPEDTIANAWDLVRYKLRQGLDVVETNKGALDIKKVLPMIMPYLEALGFMRKDRSGVYFFDDPDFDGDYGAVLCYDGKLLYYDFMYNVKDSNIYQRAKAEFNNKYIPSGERKKRTFDKLGGILRKLQTGGLLAQEIDPEVLALLESMASEAEASASSLSPAELGMSFADALRTIGTSREEAAAQKGMSTELYNRKLRTPSGSPDYYNPDSGQWTDYDYVRLGAIAADIASIPMPSFYGAAAGLGSTVANLYADMRDNSVTGWEALKNFGAGLGMDALSIIPVIGDTADAARLTKNLVKLAPKIAKTLAAYGAFATLKNGSNILESLNKVMSGEKLTVGDFLNIAQAISTLAGFSGAAKTSISKKMAQKKAKVDDAIGLSLKKKGETKALDFIFQGEKAKELRKLIEEGNPEKVTSKLLEFEGFKDYEVNTKLDTMPIAVNSPITRTKNAEGKSEFSRQNPLGLNRKIDFFEVYDKSKVNGRYVSQSLLNTQRLDAARANGREFNDSNLKTLLDIVNEFSTQMEAAQVATKRKLDIIDEQESRITKKLKELDDQVLEAQDRVKTALNTFDKSKNYLRATKVKGHNYEYGTERFNRAFNSLDTDIKNKRQTIADLSKTEYEATLLKKLYELEREKLLLKKRKTKKDLEEIKKYDSSILNLEKEITQHNLEINKVKKGLNSQEEILNELNTLKTKAESALKSKDYLDQVTLAAELVAELARTNPELAALKLRQEKLKNTDNTTSATKKLLEMLGNQTIELPIKDGKSIKLNTEYVKQHFLKKGGILKAQNGILLSNGRSWYDDIFKGYEDSILKSLKNKDGKFTKDILNRALDLHYGIYLEAKKSGDWKHTAYRGVNNSVGKYQTWYQSKGLNDLGIARNYENRYIFDPETERISGDRKGEWAIDNLYSAITDDRRILGRDGDWDESNLNAFNEKLKEFKLKLVKRDNGYYYLEDLTDSTPLSPITSTPSPTPEPTPIVTSPEPQLVRRPTNPGGNGVTNSINHTSTKESTKKGKINILGLLNNLPKGLDLLRLGILNRGNRKIAALQLLGEISLALSSEEDDVAVHRDSLKEALGQQLAADLINSVTRLPLTSDGALQQAIQLEALLKGQQIIKLAMDESNKVYELTRQLDQLLRKENHVMEHNVSEQNKLSALLTIQNKNKILASLKSQNLNDLAAFLLGIIYDLKIDAAENKALLLQATEHRINLAVKSDPNKYGAGLTASELAAYNKARSGISSADMTTAERRALIVANDKIAKTLLEQYYAFKRLKSDAWTEDANKVANIKLPASITLTNPLMAKDGTKLRIAKIRNKAKNADRFLKSVLKLLDSLDKKLDRISRSMYGLPKVEVVKAK